jgi:hypothetical protein
VRVDSRLGLPRVVPTMELMAGLAGPTTPDRSSAQGMQVNHMELPCNAQIHNALKSSAIFGMGGSNCWNLEPTSPYPEQTDGDGFQVKSLPSKFFWLCGDCAKTHIIARWRTTGPVLMLRTHSMHMMHASVREETSAPRWSFT